MKQRYIELMERTLTAYSDEHILRYFNEVKRDGSGVNFINEYFALFTY